MTKRLKEHSKEQMRWDQYGTKAIKDIEENPARYTVENSPISHWAGYHHLIGLLSPLQGKEILELGSGLGEFAVFLARQGANMTGIDIGPNLVAASRIVAGVNEVTCEFQQGNMVTLPFESDSFHIVLGLMVLHHLSESDVVEAVRETCRVLKANGRAIFYEPVENSRLFEFVQNLFPAGKTGKDFSRPSILQRKAWASYIESLDERDMTNRELISAGKGCFRSIQLYPCGLLVRLERLIGLNYRCGLLALDDFAFKIFPPLRYLSQSVIVEYCK